MKQPRYHPVLICDQERFRSTEPGLGVICAIICTTKRFLGTIITNITRKRYRTSLVILRPLWKIALHDGYMYAVAMRVYQISLREIVDRICRVSNLFQFRHKQAFRVKLLSSFFFFYPKPIRLDESDYGTLSDL